LSAQAEVARQRGWYRGWTIVAICIICQAVANGLTYNSSGLFYEDWSAQLHSPISHLTLGIAFMGVVASILSPFVGALADRYPARRLFVCGLLGMALFYLGIGSVTAAWQVLALYGLVAGPSLTLCTAIPANALIARWFVRRRGLALGLSAFGIGLSGVVLPPIISRVQHVADWRMIWWSGSVLIAVVVVPLVVLVMRNRPTEEEGRYYLSGEAAPAGTHAHAAGGAQIGWRQVATRRNFWLLVGIYLPILALSGACVQLIRPYGTVHGISKDTSALLLSLLSLMHLVAMLGLGMLSDRFGNRLPFAGLAALMVVGAVLLAMGSGLPVITLGCALVGLGGGVIALLAAAVAVEFGAEGVGRAFGMCMFFVPVITLAPWSIERIQEATGSYAPPFIGWAVLLAVSLVLSLLLRENRRAPPVQVEPTVPAPASPL